MGDERTVTERLELLRPYIHYYRGDNEAAWLTEAAAHITALEQRLAAVTQLEGELRLVHAPMLRNEGRMERAWAFEDIAESLRKALTSPTAAEKEREQHDD